MSEALKELLDRLESDAEFRVSLREDPSAAFASIGVEVTDEGLKALGDLSGTTDQELADRISMCWWSGWFIWTGGW